AAAVGPLRPGRRRADAGADEPDAAGRPGGRGVRLVPAGGEPGGGAGGPRPVAGLERLRLGALDGVHRRVVRGRLPDPGAGRGGLGVRAFILQQLRARQLGVRGVVVVLLLRLLWTVAELVIAAVVWWFPSAAGRRLPAVGHGPPALSQTEEGAPAGPAADSRPQTAAGREPK